MTTILDLALTGCSTSASPRSSSLLTSPKPVSLPKHRSPDCGVKQSWSKWRSQNAVPHRSHVLVPGNVPQTTQILKFAILHRSVMCSRSQCWQTTARHSGHLRVVDLPQSSHFCQPPRCLQFSRSARRPPPNRWPSSASPGPPNGVVRAASPGGVLRPDQPSTR